MKSSLRTLVAVSTLAALLPGCFDKKNSEGCTSCGAPGDMIQEEMMVTPEGEEEEVMVVGQNTPVTELFHDHSEK